MPFSRSPVETVVTCAQAILAALLAAAICACRDAGHTATAGPAAAIQTAAVTATQTEAHRVAETEDPASGEQLAPRLAAGDALFMIEAALESAYEISTAKLALRKGTHPSVLAHAETTIRDNARVAIALQALAETKQVRLLLRPDPVHVERLIHLRQQPSGYAFDVEYADLIGHDHGSAIRLYERALRQTRDVDVRDFADSALQQLRSRHDEVELLGADDAT